MVDDKLFFFNPHLLSMAAWLVDSVREKKADRENFLSSFSVFGFRGNTYIRPLWRCSVVFFFFFFLSNDYIRSNRSRWGWEVVKQSDLTSLLVFSSLSEMKHSSFPFFVCHITPQISEYCSSNSTPACHSHSLLFNLRILSDWTLLLTSNYTLSSGLSLNTRFSFFQDSMKQEMADDIAIRHSWWLGVWGC